MHDDNVGLDALNKIVPHKYHNNFPPLRYDPFPHLLATLFLIQKY